jgi:hypothetical protein
MRQRDLLATMKNPSAQGINAKTNGSNPVTSFALPVNMSTQNMMISDARKNLVSNNRMADITSRTGSG